ncbi:hypothetical protein BDZ90DRAFT_98100 [Jaminaea rosea]|uniref:DUF4097 domain-containing protein n=1 Tax=Jaminaea rosea TaxID=1569628 RepID=A0A316UI09_9BASI|nr:hypothetical protein BDZ90DRAFT_98100 [Jaminaea rosea]PWN24849.1 hypothetical protein BDZ90DRAFT_98100 [Jaminaea rosea]
MGIPSPEPPGLHRWSDQTTSVMAGLGTLAWLTSHSSTRPTGRPFGCTHSASRIEAFFRSVREREHAVWVGEMKRGEKDEGLVVSRSLDIQLGAGGLRVGAIQTQQHTNIALHAGSVKPTSTSASSPHLSGSIRCANLAIRLDSGSLRLASIEARNQAAIRSHAGSVRLGNLVSPEVKVVSNAGSVEGTFEVGERLDVQSDAGHVALDVKLPARTDNHTVQARAHSNAGSVRVTYVEQGKGVTLDSSVTSGTGRVEVKHHPSFEGSFDLLTRVGRLDVSPPRGSGAGGGDEREWVVREDRKGWTGRHVVGRVGREGMEGRTIVKSEAGAMQVVF